MSRRVVTPSSVRIRRNLTWQDRRPRGMVAPVGRCRQRSGVRGPAGGRLPHKVQFMVSRGAACR